MQKKYHSMNRKLLIWAGVFLVPMLALFSIGVYLAIHSFEKQLVLTNQQILKPYMSETDVILENIRQYVAYREVPESILNQMESSSATELERLTAAKALQRIIQMISIPILRWMRCLCCARIASILSGIRTESMKNSVLLPPGWNRIFVPDPEMECCFRRGTVFLP